MKLDITENPNNQGNPLQEGALSSELPNNSLDLSPAETTTASIIYRSGNDLILQNGAKVSSQVCIKSGMPVASTVWVNLRSPLKPKTWFKADKMAIGLDKANLEKFRINQTLYFSLMSLGVLMIVVGAISGITTLLTGLVLCLTGFVIRSLTPIWSPASTAASTTIRGCGEPFLSRYPEE